MKKLCKKCFVLKKGRLKIFQSVSEGVDFYRSNQYYYLAKEIPFLYYYLIPEIAAFKSYFFLKSVLHHDEWKTKKFSLNSDNTKYTNIWNNISKCYSSIPSTEIWGVENISTTIHQIQFY